MHDLWAVGNREDKKMKRSKERTGARTLLGEIQASGRSHLHMKIWDEWQGGKLWIRLILRIYSFLCLDSWSSCPTHSSLCVILPLYCAQYSPQYVLIASVSIGVTGTYRTVNSLHHCVTSITFYPHVSIRAPQFLLLSGVVFFKL